MEFFVCFIVVIAIFAIAYSFHKKTRTDNSWRDTANDVGLHFSSSGLFSGRSMTGTYDGYSVRMWTYSEGGKHKTYYTAVRVQLADVPVPLELKKDGFLRSIGTFLGGQDIQIGHDAFDRNVIVKGSDQSEIRSYLTRKRMSQLNRFFRSFPYSEITQSKLEAVKKGTIRTKSRLISMLDRAVRMTRRLEDKQTEEEQESEERIQKGMDAQNEGNMPEARRQYDKILEMNSNDVEALTQKAHVEYMDQNYSGATDLYKEALRWDPNDPMIRKNYERAAQKAGASTEKIQDVFDQFGIKLVEEADSAPSKTSTSSHAGSGEEKTKKQTKTSTTDEEKTSDSTPASDHELETVEHPSIDSTPASSADTEPSNREPEQTEPRSESTSEPSTEKTPEPDDAGLEKRSVLQELFNPQSTGVEAGKQFEEEYEGRVVTWSGTFLEFKDLSLSIKFNSKEGGLMKVLLHRGKQGTDVKRDCYGFVHVTDGLPDDLEEGDPVQFRGTLFRLDEFMRNLYISEAKLQNN